MSRFHTLIAAAALSAAATTPAWACGGCGCTPHPKDHSHDHPHEAAAEAQPTIVEIAAGDENFSILAGAVVGTGLAEALAGDGPFTVFAPTNAAFEALPEGTLESLTEEQLRQILLAHVVAGAVPAATAVTLSEAETLGGVTLPIARVDGALTIGGARIVSTDIVAGNGVIHVIDRVIIPQP